MRSSVAKTALVGNICMGLARSAKDMRGFEMLISASYNYDDIITVLVGSEEHRFRVHKDVICAKSKFFRAACSDRWLEGQEKIVRLPEARSKLAFQMYVDWTYIDELDIDRGMSRTAQSRFMSKLIELYLIGDVLDDLKLRNKTLGLLNAQICQGDLHLGINHCVLIWDHTTSSSFLWKWAVDAIVATMDPIAFEISSDRWPTDLSVQIAIKLMNQNGDIDADYKGLKKRLENYIEVDADV
jgi:hypothetical protein